MLPTAAATTPSSGAPPRAPIRSSRAHRVTGWQQSAAGAGIWEAPTPAGLDTRQLYVNGVIAPRAAIKLANSDVTLTATGLTIKNAALNYLATLPDQGRIEFESLGDFTNRYSPVESITGTTITMTQPAWDNNTWGWDTVQNSLLAAPTWYLENSLRFLTDRRAVVHQPRRREALLQARRAASTPNDLDIELPRLQTLVSIGGTYDKPVSGLAFTGIQFSGTSWLGPSSAEGYADQQNGTFLNGTLPPTVRATRSPAAPAAARCSSARAPTWHQEPAAVQVSAARRITFTDNTFTNLGQSALGIGNDANATATRGGPRCERHRR